MNYYEKYLKYKNKYFDLLGGKKNNLKEQINEIVKTEINKTNKTNILAHILSFIMKELNITNKEYMIIAGYCLREMREVGDLDVMMTLKAYKKLKKTGIAEVSISKISKQERLVIKFPEIDEEAEIEFFGTKAHLGFPTNDFSLKKLQENNKLDYDAYGNPYYNMMTCIEQYSTVNKIGDKYFIFNKFEISKERVIKNISHLTKILNFTKDKKIKKLCAKNIKYLESIIE